MWFKQVQLYKITSPINSSANALAERLESLAFKPCLPTMPVSTGWVAPLEVDAAPLTRGINGCIMICLQTEERILPASVVAQALKDKVKHIESQEARKVRQKEKLSFKDDIVHSLLPRAFTKFSRIYAYIDTRNNWLVLNCTSPKKTELFISFFKKSLGDGITTFDVAKPGSITTQWLKTRQYPQEFAIEKMCLLQDPNDQYRMIRCQQQDLFAASIQALVQEGCAVIQLALCWQDRINFVIADDFSLRSIKRADDDLAEIQEEIESKLQKFDADFILMSEMYTGFFASLLEVFGAKNAKESAVKLALTG